MSYAGSRLPQVGSQGRWDRPLALSFVLTAFALRLWSLDAKGLAYDEAASAVMARADFTGIIAFHWDAAFEHLPLWIILVRAWSAIAGQSEFALRFGSVMAAVATIALMWALLRMVRDEDLSWRSWTVALLAVSPVLLLYAQEARMYALVVFLGVASTVLVLDLLQRPRWTMAVAFVVVNWCMLGLHYYALLLLVAEALFAVVAPYLSAGRAVKSGGDSRGWPNWLCLIMLVISVVPLALYMTFSPGFQETVTVVLREASSNPPSHLAFLADLWTDLSFGAIRWQPSFAIAGFLLLPLFGLGLYASFFGRDGGSIATRSADDLWPWLFALVIFVPVAISTIMFRTLSTRYILFVAPFVFAFVAFGIVFLGRVNRAAGIVAGVLTLAVCLAGVAYYFGPYVKSEYREMARYVEDHYAADTDTVLIEAPRQHLLAKYYLGQEFPLQPVPDVPLPDYFPLTAPRIVPERVDDLIQETLDQSRNVWLILTSEPEVDPGEIVPKYLRAVSFNPDCLDWLDVRLCRYISPSIVTPQVVVEPRARFDGGLVLEEAALAVDSGLAVGPETPLFVTLDWQAQEQPEADYKVSLKLVDAQGTVVAQADDYPIGPLLPPTTWAAGDEKPGYSVLTLADGLPEGTYTISAQLYDPGTMLPVAYSGAGMENAEAINLGLLEIGDTMRLLPSTQSSGG